MESDPRACHGDAESPAWFRMRPALRSIRAESGLPALDPPVLASGSRPAALVPTEPRSLGAILRGFEPFGYLVLALAGVTGVSLPSFTIRPASPGLVGSSTVHTADVDRGSDFDILAVDTGGDRVVWFDNNKAPLAPPG